MSMLLVAAEVEVLLDGVNTWMGDHHLGVISMLNTV